MKIRDGVLLSINKSKDIKNGTFTIPDEVTSIGNGVFAYCGNLKSITIPDSVTSIGNYAFACCIGLASVTIGNRVASIGYRAFAYCISLTSVTIPDSVTIIEKAAFIGCSSLVSITIPNSVTSIRNWAFTGCRNLTSITIPDSVTSIGGAVFNDCSKLTKTDSRYYYKAFNNDLTCRDFQYEENKWFECEGEIKLCEKGFHACKNAFDLFNYYNGKLNMDIVIYKVELDGISDEHEDDSKVVAKRIRLVEKVNSYAELLNK